MTAAPLAPLRVNLDLMPSPVPERPGLLVRDPYGFAEATLIIPPPLVPCLVLFDGSHTELDLREALVRTTGRLEVGDLIEHLRTTLADGGFLQDAAFERRRELRQRAFAEAPRREAVHAGSGYPDEAEALRAALAGWLAGEPEAEARAGDVVGVAAPHVSPEGGWRSYAAAYRALGPRHAGRTFVVLGTSHFGEPERFGLTRKPFATPLGEARPDLPLLERLAAAGPAARLEDYCHAIEHSIEFQVVFLQHLYGPEVRILPVLCGPFARATQEGGRPEDDAGVAAFLDALAELARRERDRLVWVLGIDLAHIGRRYGDRRAARADRGPLVEVARRDRERLERVLAGDASGFWALLRENGDDLRWCGASPLYTFLRAVPGVRGRLLRYEQWNIDPQSVVSFAGLAFEA